jgi:hypothetical protein
MRLAVAVTLLSTCLCASAAYGLDGCGPGCHSTVNGACVVDGWEVGAVRWNECPAGLHARPPCSGYFTWSKAAKMCLLTR